MFSLPWDLDSLPYIPLAHRADLPSCAALYFVRTTTQLLYVGMTKNMRQRWSTNVWGDDHHRMPDLQSITEDICLCWMPFGGSDIAHLPRYERQAIFHYMPRLNRRDTSAGSLMQDARVRAGLSLSEVAARSGMRVSMLSKIEHNTRSFYADEAMPLARAIGCDVSVLIPGCPPEPSKESI